MSDDCQEAVDMRPIQALRHSLHRGAASDRATHRQGTALSAWGDSNRTAGRHDAQALPGRTVPADPYAVWLQQREADREREARRLNPRDAWEDLRSQSFCALGRG
jgi:hypothetical protein